MKADGHADGTSLVREDEELAERVALPLLVAQPLRRDRARGLPGQSQGHVGSGLLLVLGFIFR